jgi:hypothetical protein
VVVVVVVGGGGVGVGAVRQRGIWGEGRLSRGDGVDRYMGADREVRLGGAMITHPHTQTRDLLARRWVGGGNSWWIGEGQG